MKKIFYYIFILCFLAASVLSIVGESADSNIAYASPSPSQNMVIIAKNEEVSGGSGSSGNSEIVPIKKNPTQNKTVPQTEASKAQSDLEKIKNSGIINIVFFGLDSRSPNTISRSDTIMVVSIDEKNQKIMVTSLMRDMYIPIPGKGKNRINAAYAFGGPSLAMKTINTNFGLDIKDYVTVDFFGLEKLIDSIGGVDVNVTSAEAEHLNNELYNIDDITNKKVKTIKSGSQILNGKQAVAYCRIRYVGHADYERTERQRRVLNEIFRKIKKNGIAKLPKTISTILPYVKTSLSPGEILKLGLKGIKFKTDSIVQYRLPVDGTYKSQNINGMAVLVPNIEENKKKLYEFVYGIK